MSGLSRVANRLITKHLMMRFSSKYKLNHRGRGAINYIDVGSVGGLPDPWRANADLVRFVLNFEPNVEASRQANSLTYNTAVWEIDAVLPFYVYKGFENTGSSLFEQNLEYVKANFEQLKLFCLLGLTSSKYHDQEFAIEAQCDRFCLCEPMNVFQINR